MVLVFSMNYYGESHIQFQRLTYKNEKLLLISN